MTVSPQEPIEKTQPFSVPFRIDNTGYLAFNVTDVSCYEAATKTYNLSSEGNVLRYREWQNVDLERGSGGTVTCRFYKGPIPQAADVTIVIDYKPWHSFPLGPFRRYFRFKGAYVDNWQWTRQPSAEIEADADKQIDQTVKH